MADNNKVRFAPGGVRPAPAQTYAATRSEIFPGIDRPTMVFWLGLALIAASSVFDNGPLAAAVKTAQGNKTALESTKNFLGMTGGGGLNLIIEFALVGFLYLLALASDNSGNLAVLILVALWVQWLVRHAGAVEGFLAPAANAAPKPQTKG